jgi:hypothetical protein
MAAFRRVLDHHVGEERDEHNKLFGVARLVPEVPDTSRFWRPGPTLLDQGRTGHCGGFAAANEAQASPIRVRGVTNDYAHGYYYEIKDRGLDGFGREEGTSTQAVMKLGQARGLWAGYAWGFGMADFYRQLELGPVLCGTVWRTRMFDPSADGVLDVGGADEGGHLWLCTGRYRNYRGPSGRTYGPAIRIWQSWGEWGLGGRAVILADGAEDVIFGANGEAGVPVDRHFPPA